MIKTVREEAGILNTRFFELQFHAYPFSRNKAKTGKTSKSSHPSEDLVLVGTAASDNGALFWAAQCLPNDVRFGNIGDALNAINNRFAALGRLITVGIFEHGAPGSPGMGCGMGAAICGGPNPLVGTAMDDGGCANERSAFAFGCNGKVSKVVFYGCEVAQGTVGDQFLTNLGNLGNLRAGGFTKKTYVIPILCIFCAGLGNVYRERP